MKITGIRSYIVSRPASESKWVFLKLLTDEGIEGAGECSNYSYREHTMVRLMQELGAQYVIGSDPFRIEDLTRRLYSGIHDYRHSGMIETPVISAFEMACWDIVGKALGQPIYNLLGGACHEKLRAYSGLPYRHGASPEECAAEAVKLVEQGVTAFKFDPLGPKFPNPRNLSLKELRYIESVFGAVRKAVGDECDIGLGSHGQCSPFSAIRLAKRLEQFDLFWYEEPVPPENVDEMARVAHAINIPVAAGERRLTKFEFVDLLQKRAAAILQLDVSHCGGILEAKKIAGMAEAHYAMIAPHLAYGPVAAAAAVQLGTCSPNFLIQEGGVTWSGFRAELVKEPILWEKGYVTPPSRPGLGVELDEKVLAKYAIATAQN
jgi:2-dehydro-3-deoxyphosphogalactonate aldolase